MKRMVLFLMICMVAGSLYAQKYAIIHSQNILSALPEYTSAQEQIARLQEQYQEKLQAEYDALEEMFQQYQKDKADLTAQQRRIYEQQILDREKEVKAFRNSILDRKEHWPKHRKCSSNPSRNACRIQCVKLLKARDTVWSWTLRQVWVLFIMLHRQT